MKGDHLTTTVVTSTRDNVTCAIVVHNVVRAIWGIKALVLQDGQDMGWGKGRWKDDSDFWFGKSPTF